MSMCSYWRKMRKLEENAKEMRKKLVMRQDVLFQSVEERAQDIKRAQRAAIEDLVKADANPTA